MPEPCETKSSHTPRTPVLVSACLLGQPCRYDGKGKHDADLEKELQERGMQAISFCPEERGGLATPRPKAWIESQDAAAVWTGAAEIVSEQGQNVTAEFKAGARLALEECQKNSISSAFLKERSPSCGVAFTHVQGTLVEGPGLTTFLLAKNGISVHGR
ncbi:MAG: hypothetical protein ACI87O_001593 [Planctomycetota bacterium]|jgi:uncharacterized protein YbbK (DUF523 family)